ncbi:MAG: alpha/beta hydrolase family protein [Nannocystales bacterium]
MTPARTIRGAALLLALGLAACGESTDDGPEDSDQTPVSCAPDCDMAFVEPGDHAAGYQVLQAGDLQLKAWYPTDEPATAIEYSVNLKFPMWPSNPNTILGEAALDAPVAQDGPYPLVVLSHGFSGNPEWYRTLGEHLATHGYVVLAPEHSESDWATDVVPASLTRPADISATIDFAEDGPLSQHINAELVAVVGHSYGGYTALASAGAQYDLVGLAQRCESVEDEFVAGYFCAPFLAQQDVLAAGLGIEVPDSGLWPALGDDRVDAIAALAGDAYLFGPEGLASVTVPTLALGGTLDTGTPWDWGSAMTFEHVGSSQRYLVGMEGGEHFLPMADCADLPWSTDLPEFQQSYICNDPAWDKQEALDVVHHFTTAFLRANLQQDPVAVEALDPALYADIEAISYSAAFN